MDVSGMTTTKSMFEHSTLSSSDLQYIKNWNVSNVVNMDSMFKECSKLTDVDNLDSWKDKVKKVNSMKGMFNQCTTLENVEGLLNWKTPELKYMDEMFYACNVLKNLHGLTNWTTSKVETMNKLFYKCFALKSDQLTYLSGWDVSHVSDMSFAFMLCYQLTNLDELKSWNVSNVTNISNMFSGCSNLTHLNLSGWDLSKVTSNDAAFGSVPAGLPLQIRQYYPALDTNEGYPATPYVYGKHSYRDFENAATNGLTANPAGWTFEPCKLTVSFTGGTFTSTTPRTADAQTFYDKVKVFTNNVSAYIQGALYFAADDLVTLTLTPNDPSAVIKSVKATTTTAAGSSTTVELTYPYSFTITGNTTVAVTLQGPPAQITVDVKGGTGDISVFNNAHVGDIITLPALTKENYQFDGWDVDGDGTVDYTAGASYTVPTAVTLTAIFSDLTGTYTITYERGDAESGTVPAPQTGIAAEASVTLAGNVGGLGKEGHEFSSWTDGLNTYLPGSAFLMPAEDVTLWPVFMKVADPLPEDEIGTYYINEDGVKEYIQFHNYDICMNYMGDDNLCRNTSANLYNN